MVWIVFVVMAITLIMGIPVGFSIGISSMVYILANGKIPIVMMAQRMISTIQSFPYLALPLFILSGALMMYGSTPRIMNLANYLLRKKRWGMGYAGIVGSAAFGTISGSGVATTAAIGGVVGPEMVKQGYRRGFVAPLLGAAGTLGGVIPPSVAFVVYAQVSGVSIADMFMAGIIPGIMTAILLCVLTRYLVVKNNWGEDKSEKYANITKAEIRKLWLDAIPPLLMPVMILGGVMSGIVTATEAAAVAVVYAIILSMFVYKELTFKELLNVLKKTAISSATILLIISMAGPFAWILTYENVTSNLANWVIHFSSSIVVVYGMVLLIQLVLGTFMETLSIVLITTPIFLPVLVQYGVDPVAYGIASGLVLCIGCITPPLAVTLFTACNIVNAKIEETVGDVVKIAIVMLIATLLVCVFPQIATFLPNIM